MRSSNVLRILIVCGVMIGSLGSVSVSSKPQSAEAKDHFITYLPIITNQDENIETFRQELEEHFNDLKTLYPYVAKAAPPDLLDDIIQAQQRAATMTPDELREINKVILENPILLDGPKQLIAFFERQEETQALNVTSVDTCPAQLPDNWCGCPAGLPNGIHDVYIAKAVAQGLEFTVQFIPQDLVVAGYTIWTHPVKLTFEVFFIIAKSAELTVEGIDAVNGACTQNYHQALLVEHDEDMRTMLGNVVEQQKVQLQVIELVEKQEFLVSATKAGEPLGDVQFTSVKFSTMDDPGTFIDVTAATTVGMIDEGVYLVTIDMPVGDGSPRIYIFQVKHNNGVMDLFGFTMFDRIGPRNLGGGQ